MILGENRMCGWQGWTAVFTATRDDCVLVFACLYATGRALNWLFSLGSLQNTAEGASQRAENRENDVNHQVASPTARLRRNFHHD